MRQAVSAALARPREVETAAGPHGGSRAEADDVLQLLLARCGGAEALTIGRTVTTSPWSKVYYGQGPAFPTPVAVKVFLDPASGSILPRSAVAYYDALQKVAEITRTDPQFGSIPPIKLFEDLGVVIAGWVHGQPLSHSFHGTSRAEACRAARQAGLWIARLHEAMSPSGGSIETDRLLDQIGEELSHHPWIAEHPLVETSVGVLCRTAGITSAQAVPWIYIHGDYKPENLILSDGRLYGLDFDVINRGPIVYDAAQFLNHLSLLYFRPGALRHLVNRHRIADAFLEGYETSSGVALPRTALVWVRLHHAIRCLLKLGTWSTPPKSWITQWTVHRLIADLVEEARYQFDGTSDRPLVNAREPRPGVVLTARPVL